MSPKGLEQRIAELRARRTARGNDDPLNRLTAHINRAIARGQPVTVEQPIKGEHGHQTTN